VLEMCVCVCEQWITAKKPTLEQDIRAIWPTVRQDDVATRGMTLTPTSEIISGSLKISPSRDLGAALS